MKRAIVISASSGIGSALCNDWLQKGWSVIGTYRNSAPPSLQQSVYCDLLNIHSVQEALVKIKEEMPEWDVLVFAPGTLKPIGRFEEVSFSEWEEGIQANFLRPMKMLHELLSNRSESSTVIFFAGAGSNGPAPNYSSYAISKIALTKMCELLDAELQDVRFMIVGPGWVKTKIHQETIDAKSKAGNNFQRTLEKLTQECTPMEDVIECCNWLISSSLHQLSGRNYSVEYDAWGTKQLEGLLKEDCDLYKLRRNGNQVLVKTSEENG